MANKRMFTMKICDSDAFLDMPLSTQCLYFHLNMRADDDGFIGNPKRIQRLIGASEDDLKLLVAKRFVITFDDGVIVIKHWRMHNTIQSDRYTPTVYQEEKNSLFVKDNKAYTLNQQECLETKCFQNVSPDIDIDIGIDLEKESDIDKKKIMSDIVSYLNEVCGTNYKATTKGTVKHINARLSEGYSLDDFKTVIDKKANDWKGTDMEMYLRPETLFGTKFENYLNQKITKGGRTDAGNRTDAKGYDATDYYGNMQSDFNGF